MKTLVHLLDMYWSSHWREARHEARWFIDFYETSTPQRDRHNSHLLDFAKLDYNMVQSIYQDDIKHMLGYVLHIYLAVSLNTLL